MRIVLANKYHFLKGGAERHLFDLDDLLRGAGHETVPFAMRDGRNRETPWSRHFVSPVRTEQVSFGWQGIRTVGRSLYSLEARRRFGRLLDECRPDLVHLHNIYRQISPSILPEADRRGLPVVMTVHDYALCAPNYSLYHDGRICEVTRPDRFFRAVRHRCVKGSYAASFLVAAEMALHRRLRLWDSVDLFLAPSLFVRDKMVEYGWEAERIEVLPHFIGVGAAPVREPGEAALYVGRLSAEKGVGTLIRAAVLCPEVPFRIVGRGPEEGRLKALAERLGARNVSFVGWKEGKDLEREYDGCRLLVVPSEWHEVFGLIALEAMARSRPVLASRMGGLPEVIRDGETGLLTEPGSPESLAGSVMRLWRDPGLARQMGAAGRRRVEAEFSPGRYLERLSAAYSRARKVRAGR